MDEIIAFQCKTFANYTKKNSHCIDRLPQCKTQPKEIVTYCFLCLLAKLMKVIDFIQQIAEALEKVCN